MRSHERLDDRALLRLHCERGDLDARARLIERYLPLVRSLASRYKHSGESFDDLVQVGTIGLIKAIDRFDPDRGLELTTYAVPTILGEIKRHFRDRSWALRVPRPIQELNVKLPRLVDSLTAELGRVPTLSELAAAAGSDEERVLEALEARNAYAFAPSPAQADVDDGWDTYARFGADDVGYELADTLSVITPALRVLDQRERTILHLRFYEGLTQSEIAHRVGVSQMHVSRLIRSSLEKLREAVEIGGSAAESTA